MRDQKAVFEMGHKSVHVRQASPPRASFLRMFVVVWLALATLSSTVGIKATAAKRGSIDSPGFMAATSLFGLKGMGASRASPKTSSSLAHEQARARMT